MIDQLVTEYIGGEEELTQVIGKFSLSIYDTFSRKSADVCRRLTNRV